MVEVVNDWMLLLRMNIATFDPCSYESDVNDDDSTAMLSVMSVDAALSLPCATSTVWR